MAGFDAKLREEYALFGFVLPANGQQGVKKEIQRYLESNEENSYLEQTVRELLEKNEKGWKTWNLMRNYTCVETVGIEKPLSDPSVLEKQILSEMKYRTPANLLETILENLNLLSGSAEKSEAYQKYMEASDLLSACSHPLQNLKKTVEGQFPGDYICVNGYGKSAVRNTEFYAIQIAEPFAAVKPDERYKIKNALNNLKNENNIYLLYNQNALQYIEEIEYVQISVKKKITELEAWLAHYEPQQDPDRKYAETIRKKITNIKSVLSVTQNKRLKQELEENYNNLTKAASIYETLLEQTEDETFVNQLEFNKNINTVKNITIHTNLFVLTGNASVSDEMAELDNRNEIETELKKKKQDPEMYLIEETLFRDLPSQKKEDHKTEIFQIDSLSLDAITGISAVTKASSALKDGLKNCLISAGESILIDDYIYTYFSSRLEPVTSRISVMPSEIEYIIHGGISEKENQESVKNKIFMLRFTMNLIHIICDAEKMNLANDIGIALAGALTAGIGGPVFTALMIAGWALGESWIDINHLLEGKDVPFIKKAENWNLSISGLQKQIGSKETENGVQKYFNMKYHDYLRILLLMVPKETKILRIADIIELNRGMAQKGRYRLSEVYTQFSISVSYRVPLLGISVVLLPEKHKKQNYYYNEVYYVAFY